MKRDFHWRLRGISGFFIPSEDEASTLFRAASEKPKDEKFKKLSTQGSNSAILFFIFDI